MIYECKNIEPQGSRWEKAKNYFGFKPKDNDTKLLQEMIEANNDSEFGANTQISKSLANLNGHSNEENNFKLAEVSQEEMDALLNGLNDDEQPSKNSIQPSIENNKLIGILSRAIDTGNYQNLTKDQINEALNELTKIPVNKNQFKIVRGDISEDLKEVLREHDISKTNDYFRGVLIELLESLLK